MEKRFHISISVDEVTEFGLLNVAGIGVTISAKDTTDVINGITEMSKLFEYVSLKLDGDG